MDPLYVLRDHVVNKKSIREEGDDIVFTNARFPKATQTRFQNRINKEYFTIGVLYFAYQHSDLTQGNYVSACTKAGYKYLSLLDNKDLQAFLKGEIETSPSIDASAPIPAPPTAAAAATPASAADEDKDSKRQKTDNLQEIELDETLLEEKKLNAERLEAPKALSTAAFAGDSTYVIYNLLLFRIHYSFIFLFFILFININVNIDINTTIIRFIVISLYITIL